MAVLTDPISDFLTRWKNASRAKKEVFTAPYSKIKAEIARILQEEGYIWGFEVDTSATHPQLKVKAKYQGSTPILNDFTTSIATPAVGFKRSGVRPAGPAATTTAARARASAPG